MSGLLSTAAPSAASVTAEEPADRAPSTTPPTATELLDFARRSAADPQLRASLPLHPHTRTWVRLEGPGGAEAWLLGWPPGAETGWHDHGGSQGAFVTAVGELAEESVAVPLPTDGWRSLELDSDMDRSRLLPAGRGRAFGSHHVHQVTNPSEEDHAISVHVYYPPVPQIRRYSRHGQVLRLEIVETPEAW